VAPNPCGTCYSTYVYDLNTAGGGTTSVVATPVPCPSIRVTVTHGAFSFPVWQASTIYNAGDTIKSTDGTYVYKARFASGTSGATEPTWGPAVVVDGTVTWDRVYPTVRWCGETWVFPSDNGKSHVVCPDNNYSLFREYNVSTIGFGRFKYQFRHVWSNDGVGGGGDSLNMLRFGGMYYGFKWSPYPVKKYFAQSAVTGRGGHKLEIWDNKTDRVNFFLSYTPSKWIPPPLTPSSTTVVQSEIGQITTYAGWPYWTATTQTPTPGFLLPDAFFGSAVLATNWGNATFTWAKEHDWPS